MGSAQACAGCQRNHSPADLEFRGKRVVPIRILCREAAGEVSALRLAHAVVGPSKCGSTKHLSPREQWRPTNGRKGGGGGCGEERGEGEADCRPVSRYERSPKTQTLDSVAGINPRAQAVLPASHRPCDVILSTLYFRGLDVTCITSRTEFRGSSPKIVLSRCRINVNCWKLH